MALDVEQVALTHFGGGAQVAAAEDGAELHGNVLVVFGDVSGRFHAVGADVHNAQALLAQHGDVGPLARGHVAGVGHGGRGDLGPRRQAGAVQLDLVHAFAQVPEVEGLVGAGRHLGLAHGEEPLAQHLEADAAVGVFIGRAQGELLRAGAARDQADPEFHEAHVGLGVRNHLVGVHGEFAGAAQGHLVGRHHNRHAAVARPHHSVLEHADGVIQFFVFLLHGEHEDHAHVGAGGEIAPLVGDDDAAPRRRGVLGEVHRVVQPL